MIYCPKCGARNQFVVDLSGESACLSCGATADGPLQRVKPRAQVCSRGHPMPDGPPCFVCSDSFGRSSPNATEAQRSGMRGAIKKK